MAHVQHTLNHEFSDEVVNENDANPRESPAIAKPEDDSKHPAGLEESHIRILDDEPERPLFRKFFQMRTFVKLIVLVGVIVIIILAGQKIGGILTSLRASMQTLPFSTTIPLYCLLHAVRKLILPLYFIFPLNSLAFLYLDDKVGPEFGAWIIQLLALQDIIHFVIFSRYYHSVADALFREEGTQRHWVSRITPRELSEAILIIDRGWRRGPWGTESSARQQTLITFSFTLSYYMDSLINVFWLSTRSGATLFTYTLGLVPALAAEYPKTLISMKTALAAANALGDGGSLSLSSLITGLKEIKWYELTAFLILTGPATIVVYGNNLRILFLAVYKALTGRRPSAAVTPDADASPPPLPPPHADGAGEGHLPPTATAEVILHSPAAAAAAAALYESAEAVAAAVAAAGKATPDGPPPAAGSKAAAWGEEVPLRAAAAIAHSDNGSDDQEPAAPAAPAAVLPEAWAAAEDRPVGGGG